MFQICINSFQVKSGIHEAGKVAQIVSEDVSNSISTLVSNHLYPGPNDSLDDGSVHSSDERQREGIMSSLLRMIGLDTNQLGLMALNVLIFVAEMVIFTSDTEVVYLNFCYE